MRLMNLPRNFYERDAREVAPDLLGKLLFTRIHGVLTLGRIVETEAYLGFEDPASHAFRGKTPRNEVMFGPAGFAYVYFTYGAHFCVNAVTGAPGLASAVLIRALEPVEGISTMQQRRKKEKLRDLASGPGKLCQALGIDRSWNGKSLRSPQLGIAEPSVPHSFHIEASPRVGIRKAVHLPYRYFMADCPYVSNTR